MPARRRWAAMKEQARALLCLMLAEMEDYRDERSEVWQESERGEAFEETIAQVQEACGYVEAIM